MRRHHADMRCVSSLFLLVALCACAPAAPLEDAGPEGPQDAGPPPREPLVCGALPTGAAEGHTGAEDDVVTAPARRIVLMGGSVEVDEASKLFVEGAGGGDVLVARASGSVESYLPYFADELSADPAPNSVRVVRLDNPAAGAAESVVCRVHAAEALWLAGGDQWSYLGLWPAELHAALDELASREATIGGTSAGAMSLGELTFDAKEGSMTSSEALAAPTAAFVSVSRSPFGQPELAGTLVDTHFSEREREGRMLALLARAAELTGETVVGIGLDERAALVLENDTATTVTSEGRSVWLYRFAGGASLQAGSALSLAGVERVRLDHGDTLVWPPVWTALAVDILDVTDGVVDVR
jgi:cyanophycinase-like exopeptidase